MYYIKTIRMKRFSSKLSEYLYKLDERHDFLLLKFLIEFEL